MTEALKALAALVLLALNAAAQSATTCSRDPAVEGYSSIAAMNSDMQAEFDRISAGGAPENSYTFRLCPNMIFDASTAPLLPMLDNTMFVCGNDGSRNNNCIILGGSEQIRIENSQLDSYPLQSLTFVGLSFADFQGNDATTGTSIAALASAPTTATFMDVTFTDFESDFVIRQTTGFSPDPPMTIMLEDSTVVSGTSGVVFDNDGGRFVAQNIQISGITTAAIVATANAGTSFLQDTTVSTSDVDSVTFATAMGSQTVMGTTVSDMSSLDDVFYAEGEGSLLSVVDSTISNNNVEAPMTWSAVVVQSGASATVMDMIINDNTGMEFGLSATLGGMISIVDSVISNNVGVLSLNTTTAPIFAISDSTIAVETTEVDSNSQFSAAVIGLLRSNLALTRSCFENARSEFVVFVDSTSQYTAEMNFVDSYQSDQCPIDGRLFQEAEGSGCFVGGGVCQGDCEVFADQDMCLARVAETETPTSSPVVGGTQTPTISNATTPAPSPMDTTPAPSAENMTLSPSMMINETFAPTMSMNATNNPTMPPGVPTTSPTTASPTTSPSMTPEPTSSISPSASPTISSPPTTSPAPTVTASASPTVFPTNAVTPEPTSFDKKGSSKKSKSSSSPKRSKSGISKGSTKRGKRKNKKKSYSKSSASGKGKGKGNDRRLESWFFSR